MARTEIYTKDWCPYSQRALALLRARGIAFTAYDLTRGAAAREMEMRERSGRTSVPQIFIDGSHIGGFDELAALDAAGGLESLISNGAAGYAA